MKLFDIYINLFIFLVFTDLTIRYKKILKTTNNTNNNIEDNFLFLPLINNNIFKNFKYNILVLKIIFDLIYLKLFVKFLNCHLIGILFMFISIYKFINILTSNLEKVEQFNFSKKLLISDSILKLLIYFMLNLLSFFQLLNYCKRKKNKEIDLTFPDLDEIQNIENK